MDAAVARHLRDAAAAAGTRIVLIRRPGRHPAAGSAAARQALAWALADTSPRAERILWGTWREPADLLDLDLTASIPGEAHATGPQRLVLVCTNGKRDQCCAIRGRPVAAALAVGTDWEGWECSHLGGHRFAATIMLLPTGDMFGWLDPESAVDVVRRFDAGQFMLSYYRGRAGQPAPVQAALHTAAVRLGEFRRGALQVSSACPVPVGRGTGWPEDSAEGTDLWEVEVIHRTEQSPGTAYRVIMTESRLAPGYLSCSDSNPKADIHYETLSFSLVG
jgi:hypothetical protein